MESVRVGRIVEVTAERVICALDDHEPGHTPTATIGHEDIEITRLGTLLIAGTEQSPVLLVVTRASEREDEVPLDGEGVFATTDARRLLTLTPLGQLSEDAFRQGIAQYPSVGTAVSAVKPTDLAGLFAPPDSLTIGSMAPGYDLAAAVDVDRLLSRHFAILGQTGAGKSWATARLIQSIIAAHPKARIILLDPHGEYSAAFSDDMTQRIDANTLELPYWILTFSQLAEMIVDIQEQTAHNQIAYLRTVVDGLRKKEAERLNLDKFTVDTPIFFSVDDLRSMLADKDVERVMSQSGREINGPLNGQLTRMIMRLDSRLHDVRYKFIFRPQRITSSESITQLLSEISGFASSREPLTIIDISSVPFDVRPMVAAQISRLIFELNYWNDSYRSHPVCLVAEEAHAFAPAGASAQYAGSREAIERIAKEGRKYGVSLGLVSQRPHELSPTALAQSGTFVCLRITNPEDQAYIRRMVPEGQAEMLTMLAALQPGEAIVLGDAVGLPVRIRFDAPDPPPDSDDVLFSRAWDEASPPVNLEELVSRWRMQLSARST